MLKIYKGQKVYVHHDTNLLKVFKWCVKMTLDFGVYFLPIIILVAYQLLKFNPNLFLALYIASLILSVFWMYLAFVNFYRINIVKYSLRSLKITKPFKFVFLSDLHIGTEISSTNKIKLKKIVKIINSLELNTVLIGGDILDNQYNLELLQILKQIKGQKYAVLGNHDTYYLKRGINTKETPKRLLNDLKSFGIDVLQNDGVSLENEIFLGGIKDMFALDFDIEKSLEGSIESQYKILMSHNPDITNLKDDVAKYDLVLSGHNHGGQIRIGKFHLPLPSQNQNLLHGIYKINKNTALLQSSGAGSSMRIRLGTSSEILVIEIKPE